MARSFAERSHETELMDTETVSLDDYRACLKDLSTVNALTLTHRPIVQWLDHATRDLKEGERVSVIDVGYGYGDLLRKIHEWSRRRNRNVELIGVDLNPMSEPIARAATPGRMAIDYRTGNVFDFKPERPIDFIISSQTTHHMSNDELAVFIRWMEQVGNTRLVSSPTSTAIPCLSISSAPCHGPRAGIASSATTGRSRSPAASGARNGSASWQRPGFRPGQQKSAGTSPSASA